LFKQIVGFVAAFMLVMAPVSASAAPIQSNWTASHETAQSPSQTTNPPQSEARSSGGYHSGFRAPSSGVSRPSSSGSRFGGTGGYGFTGSGFGSHLFSFGAGWMIGSMFHPFGGYYGMGGGYHGFSIFSLIIDIILIVLVWKFVRWILRRR
jgi:hypothetical protein